jgi:hypothetical protein
MRQRTKAGTSRRRGGASKGGRQQRFRFARRVEELAASLGLMLGRQKAGRRRPLRTERGGKSRTRSVNANTRRWRAAKTTVKKGRKIGLGRKRVRSG